MGSAPRSSEGIYKTSAIFSPAATATPAAATAVAASSGSAWRYLLIFLILILLFVNLVLFLIKPTDKPLNQMYDPLFEFLNHHFGTDFKLNGDAKKKIATPPPVRKANTVSIKNIENKIDPTPPNNSLAEKEPVVVPIKNYKKLPVIPQADDSTSRMQMGPASKAGFCYIGEDRGFRSCIEVGNGDVCMSGNIFPSEAHCINPRLRE